MKTLPRFRPYVDTIMDHEPVYIESRRSLGEQLKKRGLVVKN